MPARKMALLARRFFPVVALEVIDEAYSLAIGISPFIAPFLVLCLFL
jgi:hypothetical protein